MPRFRRYRRHPPAPRTSAVLRALVENGEGRIALGTLFAALGERAFGAILLVLALFSMIPIPGLTTIVGIPMALIAAQLMVGTHRPWLPRRVLGWTVALDDVRKLLRRILPTLERVERALRPRLPTLTDLWGERLIGAVCLIMALVLMLPIPFANLVPAFAVALLALGLVERDGLFVILGMAVAAAAFMLLAGVGLAAVLGVVAIVRGWLP